ncbi:hypothetical protein B0H15DRAFT_920255 [Mycena belliarum]|uniref:F-box domain-containing protein n=1 Tax=Mycena belliarum TaxID=1033014 RepID=A0AAD6UEG0_9AGAR|nr:hypothetical protein B0H15DRAFT_920255 [Mycena belliae]
MKYSGSAFPRQDLPLDLLRPILEQLAERQDWNSCALVSKNFNRVAIPLLYSVLDSRVVSKNLVYHPSTTLNQRPELAQYVRHVTETGAVHRGLLGRYPRITENTLRALALCTNLRSMTWIDDYRYPGSPDFLLAFISAIRHHPLRALTIRSHSELGEATWAQLTTLTGLRKISIWCLEGPPYLLGTGTGWADHLRSTLTHLELGRCAGIPNTLLISVLAHLPLLQDIRLKGAPSNSIPTILTFLPNLRSLDTEYLVSGPSNARHAPERDKMATLQHLTVRTSSIDIMGPAKLWNWITSILPRAGLETFKLHAFTLHLNNTHIPRAFLLDLATIQGSTLRHFIAGDAELTLPDVECLCAKFPRLETLMCLVVAPDVDAIAAAVEKAASLKNLRLQVKWIMSDGQPRANELTLEQARSWMLRDEHSLLRVVGMNSLVYTGKWILAEDNLKFEVVADVEGDKWNT